MADVTRWGLSDRIERHAEIVKKVLNGRTCGEVAREYGRSIERVRQQTAKYCRLANRAAYAQMPPCKTVNIPWLQQNKEHFLPHLPNADHERAAKA